MPTENKTAPNKNVLFIMCDQLRWDHLSCYGAELVTDRVTKAPATNHATRVANEMRRRGILLNKLGIHYNTLKIRPPMPFSKANADLLLNTLDSVLEACGPALD